MLAESRETQEKQEKEKKDEENKANADSNKTGVQTLAVIIVFVIAFAAVFLYMQSTKASEKQYEFQGVRVVCVACAGDAQTALHSILAKPKVLMRQELTGVNSSANTIVAIAAAQIARNFQKQNKTMYAFGVVDGVPQIECNEYTDNCSHAEIEVAVGSCNCLRIDAGRGEGGVARVEGTEEWFRENNYARVMTIAGIIGGALQ